MKVDSKRENNCTGVEWGAKSFGQGFFRKRKWEKRKEP